MAGWCDEVEKGMHTCILEPWLPLNSAVNCEDLVELPLNVTDNLSKPVRSQRLETLYGFLAWCTDPASLLIWSPKPGVLTTVSAMRVPSSSISNSVEMVRMMLCEWWRCVGVNFDVPTVTGLMLTPSSK